VPGPASLSLLRSAWVVAIDNCRGKGDWDMKLHMLVNSVRAGSVSQRSSTAITGHERSLTVQRNRRSQALRLKQLG
jgi:hypothetical protein